MGRWYDLLVPLLAFVLLLFRGYRLFASLPVKDASAIDRFQRHDRICRVVGLVGTVGCLVRIVYHVSQNE